MSGKKLAASRHTKQGQSKSPGGRLRWCSPAAVSTLSVLLVLFGSWYLFSGRHANKDFLASARQSALIGDVRSAELEAWKAWTIDPRRNEAALLAAEMAYKGERFREAVDYASHVSAADTEKHREANKLSAFAYHLHLHQFSDAERAYRAVLHVAEEDAECNAGLANLLGLCGRRFEAVPLVLRLIRMGKVSDLLMLLAREGTVVNDIESLHQARRSAKDDPLPLLGLAWHAAESGNGEQAVQMLREAMELDTESAPVKVAILKQYAALGMFDEARELEADLKQRPALMEAANQFADTWVARARLAEHTNDTAVAVRCYAEAARLAPDSKTANAQLAQLLEQIGDSTAAARFSEYAASLRALREAQDRVFFSGEGQSLAELLDLIDHYETVGRFWEASGWCQIAVGIDASNTMLVKRLQVIKEKTHQLPLQLVAPDRMPVSTLNVNRYPLPTEATFTATANTAVGKELSPASFAFRDDAQATNLRFRFVNGTDGTPLRKMFEFTGGGIGVLDYDADGWPDVALTQGTLSPLETGLGTFTDKLMRNVNGRMFEEVGSFRLDHDGYGQGITSGDYDCDGFPDLYIAQIGQNRLLRNNGDGTFTDMSEASGIAAKSWTTSCVIADLNGDSLPDIYDVNYVEGPDVFSRVCADSTGHPAICLPGDFDAAQDQLWINNGDGSFRDGTASSMSELPSGKGLGVVVMDSDQSGRLSLLVANDTTPNFWFVPQRGSDGKVVLHERAIVSGLAFDADGKAKGCMGLATADVNNDAKLDLVITNFYNEASTFYMNRGAGQFSDKTRAVGLYEPSLRMLGFGTQFLDANLDGLPELFVANGHIDDLRRNAIPYEMESQLFTLRDGRFHLQLPDSIGQYFQRKVLGRSVAKIDWNRDGREDLIVGHLNCDYALLTNITEPYENWITVRLVGKRSDRDAIGTTVEVICGDKRFVKQLTAGDGYQASNQRQLVMPLGQHKQVDQLRIHWPSGARQELSNIAASSELLIVEDQPAWPSSHAK